MVAVAVVAVLIWLAMVAEYHLSRRAYDDWVDSQLPSASSEHSGEAAEVIQSSEEPPR